MSPKIVAMYLPQFHRTPENDKWWGEGFTDWVSCRKAEPLFEGHQQPKLPLNEYYYDLSKYESIKWQADIARRYGVDGWAIYHYWFKDGKKVLNKPAEIILENKEIDMPFCFAWDNTSWIRTWSKVEGMSWGAKTDTETSTENTDNGVLLELDYGREEAWEQHFNYLLPFFLDDRYIKIDGRPVFIFFTNNNKSTLIEMCRYWNQLAKAKGFSGVYLITRQTPFNRNCLFDATIKYEPAYSGWQAEQILGIVLGIKDRKKVDDKPRMVSYDKIWKKIIRHTRFSFSKTSYSGAFIDFDDTPRKGGKGVVVQGATPEKFGRYLEQLYRICKRKGKEFIFVTAWNEWGEGAVLEPSEKNEYKYLEQIKNNLKKNKNKY